MSFFILVAFQNCDSSVPVSGDDRVTSLAKEQDFVYDTVVDQIAYMSCSEVQNQLGADTSTYFTFRLGAYSTQAGIRLKDSFMELTDKSSVTERLDVLNIGPGSKAMQLQMALRPSNDLQSIFAIGGGGGKQSEDFNTIFTVLGEDYPSSLMLAAYENGARVRYARDSSGQGYRIEGELRFAEVETLANQVRDFLTNTGVLALTYQDSAENGTAAIAPQDLYPNENREPRTRSVYGSGLGINFRSPGGTVPARIISSVQERSLENPSDTASRRQWTCNGADVFKIILPEDAVAQGCNMLPDDLSNANRARLEYLRRSLRPEDWYIDLANNCIVPKKFLAGNCYGKQASETIEYNPANACDPAVGNVTPLCPHYVSICTR